MSVEPAVEIQDLEVVYRVRGVDRPVLRGLTLTIGKGESYGLVGESGCGKTTAAFTIMRYLPRNGRVVAGSIRADGADLLAMGEDEVRRLRATTLSMVYQNPGAALNPSIRIGDQLAEVFRLKGAGRDEAHDRAREILRRVQVSDPARAMRRYAHQLSGGGQQRVVIAMALASDPTLLILDEPTTGLDATVEAEVLDLVAGLKQEFGTSILFISHNLGVIRKMCGRVGVLYAGRLVEEGAAQTVLAEPRHPYTVGLLRCIPRGGLRKDRDRLDTIPGYLPQLGAHLPGCVYADRCALVQEICRTDEPRLYPLGAGHASRCHFHEQAGELPRTTRATPVAAAVPAAGEPVVRLGNATKTFAHEGSRVRALVDVDLAIGAGETLGLVGESGSGKTTLARVLLGLTAPDQGSVVELDGRQLEPRIVKRDFEQVRALQTVFQNPDSALNRRASVRRIIGRAVTKLLGVRGKRREARLREIASSVRFDERLLSARPVQLSGGLKQRVAIGRAFAGDPRVVVCDEPTSALDVSVQAAILNLLADLQAEQGVTYLFISHDLGVVRYLSDRIAVLYLGRVMELGAAETVFNAPHHPYTEALLSAVPTLEGEERPRIRLAGEIPSAADPPSGCVFHTRCPRKLGAICEQEEPPLAEVERGHFLRCHISLDELRSLQAEPPAARWAQPDASNTTS
ncbi:MAG TPA: ABC transporter ATP-binding protein [Gaiellaceae bacterium]|nr:ABC transporter ATP-binding protein [Gaiellaceae bacterium]